MSINVVGVGPLVYKQDANMRKIAGTDGKVFLYADFALLSSHFDDIMESACSKLLLLSAFINTNSTLSSCYSTKSTVQVQYRL